MELNDTKEIWSETKWMRWDGFYEMNFSISNGTNLTK
jgi:hypothetical protein